VQELKVSSEKVKEETREESVYDGSPIHSRKADDSAAPIEDTIAVKDMKGERIIAKHKTKWN
jgi:hypothetical protein